MKLIIGTFLLLTLGCSHSTSSKNGKYRFIQSSKSNIARKAGALFHVEANSNFNESQSSQEISFTTSSLEAIPHGKYELILPDGVQLTQGQFQGDFNLNASEPITFDFEVRGLKANENIIFHAYRWENGERRGTPFVWNSQSLNNKLGLASTSSKKQKARRDKFKKIVY